MSNDNYTIVVGLQDATLPALISGEDRIDGESLRPKNVLASSENRVTALDLQNLPHRLSGCIELQACFWRSWFRRRPVRQHGSAPVLYEGRSPSMLVR